MAETISMPKLGFDMQEGVLIRWVKNEGENVNKGDVLAEIETDKATVEVESSASGVVRKLLVEAGTIVPIGDPIAIVGTADEKIDAPAAGAAPKAEAKPEAKAESKAEPKADEKEKPPVPSKDEGAAPAPAKPQTAPAQQAAAPVQTGPVKASPLAKKIATDNKVDLARVQGSGPGGRVVRKDVEAALSGGGQRSSAGASASSRPVSTEDQVIQTT